MNILSQFSSLLSRGNNENDNRVEHVSARNTRPTAKEEAFEVSNSEVIDLRRRLRWASSEIGHLRLQQSAALLDRAEHAFDSRSLRAQIACQRALLHKQTLSLENNTKRIQELETINAVLERRLKKQSTMNETLLCHYEATLTQLKQSRSDLDVAKRRIVHLEQSSFIEADVLTKFERLTFELRCKLYQQQRHGHGIGDIEQRLWMLVCAALEPAYQTHVIALDQHRHLPLFERIQLLIERISTESRLELDQAQKQISELNAELKENKIEQQQQQISAKKRQTAMLTCNVALAQRLKSADMKYERLGKQTRDLIKKVGLDKEMSESSESTVFAAAIDRRQSYPSIVNTNPPPTRFTESSLNRGAQKLFVLSKFLELLQGSSKKTNGH